MHKSSSRLPLAAVDLEVNFQTDLVPISLQLPPNPPGFVNLFSTLYGLGSDSNGLRVHWERPIIVLIAESCCITADSTSSGRD